jgi:hypothetical protein
MASHANSLTENMSYDKLMPQPNSMSIISMLTQPFHLEEAALPEVASSTIKIKSIAEEKLVIRAILAEVSIRLTINIVLKKFMMTN